MAIGEMYDYLPTKTADYDALLDIACTSLDDEGYREILTFLSASKETEAVLLGGDTEFVLTVNWDTITRVQAATIMDLFLDPAKCDFGSKSIRWQHPTDGEVYVVHLLDPKRVDRNDGYSEIKNCHLLVVGKIIGSGGEPIAPYAYSRYWGVSPDTTVDNADILAFDSEFSTSKSKSVIYNCTGGNYPYFCYPAAWGALSVVTVFGLVFTDYLVTVQDFTDAEAYTTSFNVVRFNNLQNGSSISVGWS